MTFKEIYNKVPIKLKFIVDQTKHIKQNPLWHPEIYVYDHIVYVTNRLDKKYHDINLTLSGFFHDLGKVKTTIWDEDKESWTAHGHEDDSSNIVQSYIGWIKKMGGNPEIIDFIVQNHMRIKYLDEFRLQEKIRFLNEPLFDYVHKFSTADYGGTDLECKPLMDLSVIEEEISDYNIREEEKRIIASKFNGRIIMDLYPELKGKELGDVISGFKRYFDDFESYALYTDKEQILQDFDFYYNGK